jgi:uncharacterized membrane protein
VVRLIDQRLIKRRQSTSQPTLGHKAPSFAEGAAQHNVTMTSLTPSAGDAPSQAPAQRLGAMLVGMGVLHFAAPKPFDTIVPTELPGSQRFYTYASGVAEMATGALLLAPRTRRIGALVAIAVFLGVYPANINMVRLWWGKGWPARIASIARLPLQVPMVTMAYKAYRNAPR